MESLIYYGIRKDSKYLDNEVNFTYSMQNLMLFESKQKAKDGAKLLKAEVRQMKIYDIGGIENEV